MPTVEGVGPGERQCLRICSVDLERATYQLHRPASESAILGHGNRVGIIRQESGVVEFRYGAFECSDRFTVSADHDQRSGKHGPSVRILRVCREFAGQSVDHHGDLIRRGGVRSGARGSDSRIGGTQHRIDYAATRCRLPRGVAAWAGCCGPNPHTTSGVGKESRSLLHQRPFSGDAGIRVAQPIVPAGAP